MKKILTLFLIFLLILPIVMAKEERKESKEEVKEESKSSNWGFIFFTRFKTNYGELAHEYTWWGLIDLGYTIVGIGRHDIHWEIEYEIYTYDEHGPQPRTGIFQGNDSIYLFDLTQQPIFKPMARKGYFWSFFLYNTGHWTAYLYIDGELTDEEYFEWTHQ